MTGARTQNFVDVSRRLGVLLDPRSVVRQVRDASDVTAGAEQSLSQIDPARYVEGTVVGTIEINAPKIKLNIPNGVFSVKTQIEAPIVIGLNRGKAVLSNANGQAITVAATYEVRQLRVPESAYGNVNVLFGKTAFLNQTSQADDDEICVGIEWECDNGATFCLGIVIDPTPIDPPQ